MGVGEGVESSVEPRQSLQGTRPRIRRSTNPWRVQPTIRSLHHTHRHTQPRLRPRVRNHTDALRPHLIAAPSSLDDKLPFHSTDTIATKQHPPTRARPSLPNFTVAPTNIANTPRTHAHTRTLMPTPPCPCSLTAQNHNLPLDARIAICTPHLPCPNLGQGVISGVGGLNEQGGGR